MKFMASERQIKEMAVNATKAALPLGMGILHYDAGELFTPDRFVVNERGLSLDYVSGRCVKLYILKLEDPVWEISSFPADPEYQTWAYKYPTFRDLVLSVIDEDSVLT